MITEGIWCCGMYVGDKWAYITKDHNRMEWLKVDDKVVAQVTYTGKTFTWYDEVGNIHHSKSFKTMVKQAVSVYNALSRSANRSVIKL